MITEDQLTTGTRFSTRYESNCIVVTAPDSTGTFTGLDSDEIECSFSMKMVTKIHNDEE